MAILKHCLSIISISFGMDTYNIFLLHHLYNFCWTFFFNNIPQAALTKLKTKWQDGNISRTLKIQFIHSPVIIFTFKVIPLEKVWTHLSPPVMGFTNGPGDLGSIPGWVIPKTQKMVLGASLLNTQHYKVQIKGKVEQSKEKSSTLLCGPMLVMKPNVVWLLVTVLVVAIVFMTTTLASGCLLCQILPCPHCVWKIHGGGGVTQFSRIFFWRSGNVSG